EPQPQLAVDFTAGPNGHLHRTRHLVGRDRRLPLSLPRPTVRKSRALGSVWRLRRGACQPNHGYADADWRSNHGTFPPKALERNTRRDVVAELARPASGLRIGSLPSNGRD